MTNSDQISRKAGILYLVLAITGAFSIMFVPSLLIVHGNGIETANNILDNELLYRVGIVSGLISQALFVFLALELFRMLKHVDKTQALTMLTIVIVSVPIAFMNSLNEFATLFILKNEDVASLPKDVTYHLVELFIDLRDQGILIAGLFWGLWLFPFGQLVYKSGTIPKIFGVLLMIGCFGYIINFLFNTVLPANSSVIPAIATIPSAIAEFSMIFWLLIKGLKYESVSANSPVQVV